MQNGFGMQNQLFSGSSTLMGKYQPYQQMNSGFRNSSFPFANPQSQTNFFQGQPQTQTQYPYQGQQFFHQNGAQMNQNQRSASLPPQPKQKPHLFNRLLDSLAFECNKLLLKAKSEAPKANKPAQELSTEEAYRKVAQEEFSNREKAIELRESKLYPRSSSYEGLQIQVSLKDFRKDFVKRPTKQIPFTRDLQREQNLLKQASSSFRPSPSATSTGFIPGETSFHQSPNAKTDQQAQNSVEAKLSTSLLTTPTKLSKEGSSTIPCTPNTPKNNSDLSTAINSNPPEKHDAPKHKLQPTGISRQQVEKKLCTLDTHLDRPTLRKSQPAVKESQGSNAKNISMKKTGYLKNGRELKKRTLEVALKIIMRSENEQTKSEEELAIKDLKSDSVFLVSISILQAPQLESCTMSEFSKLIVEKAIEEFDNQLSKLRKAKVYIERLEKDSFLGKINAILRDCQKHIEEVQSSQKEGSSNHAEFKSVQFLRGEITLPISNYSQSLVSDWFDFSSTFSKVTCAIVEKKVLDFVDSNQSSSPGKGAHDHKLPGTECGEFIFADPNQGRCYSDPDIDKLLARQGVLTKVKGLTFFNSHGKVTFLDEIRLSKVTSTEEIVQILPFEIVFDDDFIAELKDGNFNESRSLEIELVHYNVPQKMWYKVASLIEERWDSRCVFSVKDNNSVTFRADLNDFKSS